MQLHDARENGFATINRRVLADDDGSLERRLVGFVAAVAHTARGQGAAAVVVLQFVPLERFGVRLVPVVAAVCFQQHNGHAGNLPHGAGAAGLRGLGGVKAFMVGAGEQLP